jgi:hypothetical protein
VEKEIIALYGGRIAQAKYVRRRIDWGYESDDYQIADIASHHRDTGNIWRWRIV